MTTYTVEHHELAATIAAISSFGIAGPITQREERGVVVLEWEPTTARETRAPLGPCVTCGQPIPANRSRLARFCSPRCRALNEYKARRLRREGLRTFTLGPCAHCGGPIENAKRPRRYCSQRCNRKAWEIEHPDQWARIKAASNERTKERELAKRAGRVAA